MGQIIPFPNLPRPFPVHAGLGEADNLLLGAMRWWAIAHRRAESPLPRLRANMAAAGVAPAAFAVDALMGVLVRSARRTIDCACLFRAEVSDHEALLLDAAGMAQGGDASLGAGLLRRVLITDEGAERACAPLESLGVQFAAAGLVFRWRPSPRGPRVAP